MRHDHLKESGFFLGTYCVFGVLRLPEPSHPAHQGWRGSEGWRSSKLGGFAPQQNAWDLFPRCEWLPTAGEPSREVLTVGGALELLLCFWASSASGGSGEGCPLGSAGWSLGACVLFLVGTLRSCCLKPTSRRRGSISSPRKGPQSSFSEKNLQERLF